MTNPGGRGWSGNEKALDRGEGLLVLLLLLCLRRGMARNLGAPGWDRTSNPCLRRAGIEVYRSLTMSHPTPQTLVK